MSNLHESLNGVPVPSAAPAGWKLVPVEPTNEMVAAACREHGYPGGSRSAYVLGYKSMLAASPTPPAEQQAQPGAVYGELPRSVVDYRYGGGLYTEAQLRDYVDRTHAARLRCKSEQARLATLWGYVREDATPKQAAPKAAPQQEVQEPMAHDEDLLERLYWEFDAQRKKTGEERLTFKRKMRFYASEFRRLSMGKIAFTYSVSDEMMNLADRLGSESDDVDPRAWKHLLVYAPQPAPAPLSDEVVKDAERYRWLRTNAIGAFITNNGNGPVSVYHLSKIPALAGIPEETDAAIDAAIAAQGGKV